MRVDLGVARPQVLLDVSGLMGEQVPGTGLLRMAVTVQAAIGKTRAVQADYKLGMWLFVHQPGR